MSPLLLAAVIVGQVALAVAGLVLSRVVQVFQVDARRPGALVDQPDRRTPMVRPPELERLERLLADAVASDVTAAVQLLPLLTQLGRDAPGGPVPVPPPGRNRRAWAATVLADLERAWGIEGPSPRR